ncbi:MAG: response regulator [Ignavibacteria bacterium]|nr:response regulator [Ignavibacteria bacterium]MDP3830677.1 response regulator [Ignavibacteriaceae bacterium]
MFKKIFLDDIGSYNSFIEIMNDSNSIYCSFILDGGVDSYSSNFIDFIRDQKIQLADLSSTIESAFNAYLGGENLLLKKDQFVTSLILINSKAYRVLLTAQNSVIYSKKENSNFSYLSSLEFNNLLSFQLGDTTPENLYSILLQKCCEATRSEAGITIILQYGETEFFFNDLVDEVNQQSLLQKELTQILPVLIKWFQINKKNYLTSKESSELTTNLMKQLRLKEIIFAPCFTNNELSAIITIAKNRTFSDNDIHIINQFSLLLGFSLTLIKANEFTKHLETRLAQKQRLETLGKLASGISHDFSNLLSGIFGSVNLLKRINQNSKENMRFLENIENAAVRGKDLVKGLLSYGKPTARLKKVIDLRKIINDVANVVQQTFPAGIDLQIEIKDDICNVIGYEPQLYQVILNLCVNAKEAINDSGTVIIKAANQTIDKENHIEFPLLSEGEYLLVSVIDSGSGISDENILRIFDPYFSTKRKETGSGLGLYVSYGIIKAHQGMIDVMSIEGKGTRFDIYLPAQKEYTKPIQVHAEKIILLAEDEIMLQELLTELLEASNFAVIKVNNGNEVLRILTEEMKIDLLIIDNNMPEMNGVECIKEIRKLKFNFPIILSSGNYKVSENIDPSGVGITTILNKPYDFETMLTLINTLV